MSDISNLSCYWINVTIKTNSCVTKLIRTCDCDLIRNPQGKPGSIPVLPRSAFWELHNRDTRVTKDKLFTHSRCHILVSSRGTGLFTGVQHSQSHVGSRQLSFWSSQIAEAESTGVQAVWDCCSLCRADGQSDLCGNPCNTKQTGLEAVSHPMMQGQTQSASLCVFVKDGTAVLMP